MCSYLNCSLSSSLVYISTSAFGKNKEGHADDFEESAKNYTITITSKVCSEKQHAS